MNSKPNSNPKPNRNNISTLRLAQLNKQYEGILKALQGLYMDVSKTSDKQLQLESDLHDIKKTLIDILQYHKSLKDFESKVFRNNLNS